MPCYTKIFNVKLYIRYSKKYWAKIVFAYNCMHWIKNFIINTAISLSINKKLVQIQWKMSYEYWMNEHCNECFLWIKLFTAISFMNGVHYSTEKLEGSKILANIDSPLDQWLTLMYSWGLGTLYCEYMKCRYVNTL